MQRLQPGPFNGLFDTIDFENAAFAPVLWLTCLLVFVIVATAWALHRRPRPRRSRDDDRRRGFEAVR